MTAIAPLAGVGNTGTNCQSARPVVALTRSAVHARQDEALRLRQQGMSYAEIARRVGFTVNAYTTGRETARRAVMAALARRAKRTAFSRTFGIELETQGLGTTDAAVVVAAALGVAHVHVTAYHGSTCHTCRGDVHAAKGREWVVEADGSIGSAASAAEVISPALSGEAGLAEVQKVAAALKAAGARVSRSCGMHVHVGAADLSGEALGRLVETYTEKQDVINTVLPVSRRSNQYAVRYTRPEVARIVDTATNGGDARAVAALAPRRYRTVNLMNFTRIGTVEYRQHSGSLDFPKIEAWVRFVVALTDAAEQAVSLDAAADIASLTGVLAEQGLLTEQAAAFLVRRAASIRA